MNNEELIKRIEALESELKMLRASSTIPLDIERAFENRGFLTERFFVMGSTSLNVSGESFTTIPGATANSVALVSMITAQVGGGTLEASIIPSPTSAGNYDLYVQGVATETFFYIVFLTNNPFEKL